MSAPIVDPDGKVVGVIQVSQKSQHPSGAGPDFTTDDLRKLERLALSIGKAMPKL
jgi:transcriptional regulator of acetoin/glycerol metabolism